MQNDLVAPRRMLTAIGTMKGRIGCRNSFQIDQPRKAAQVAGQCGPGRRLQQQGGLFDLSDRQAYGAFRVDQVAALAKSKYRDAAILHALSRLDACSAAREQKTWRDETGVERGLQLSGDTLGLVVDAFGLVVDDRCVLLHPRRVPMLDLDHKDSLWADDDLVDLIGKPRRMAGMADVRQEHPRTRNALKPALDFLDGEFLARIDRHSAGDMSEAGCRHGISPFLMFVFSGL